MSQGNKFGAFKGVFTPSILTILGVIMYLRLPWIVGQAGLWAALGIVLVAHIISATTGLSVASIATDKKVETGGTYYMISRSLGLPIGGTLGLALFVGLSFSVSLYLIGFAETLLNAFSLEATINNIRLTGVVALVVITILTFISTSLALKTQFIILAVLLLSLVSIFLGKHDLVPTTPLADTAPNSLPWIALFAIFFPAVTGFEAGVSMSGDLANPKKSIPIGTIMAILVGLLVYVGLVFFFAYTVERDSLANDSAVLFKISFYSPLVVAGIWGATLSSALGSILGAPRILQATAIDRITPKPFAKGVGAGNEPRNAIIVTFFIALSGILIGELNVIARIVSIFFIITYGFLNLTCAIENWAGSDFRPSFKIPAWVSIIGAIACFVVMIQLDLAAMIGATILLGAVFFLLKRRELNLQSGDTWGSIWSSLVKYGLLKLSTSSARDQRNWRPNIILFSGGSNARPHLIEMSRMLVGKLGVFTNFELVESKDKDELLAKAVAASIDIDTSGKKVITRKHFFSDIYEGIQMIGRVYGFTGFEPNTILMGVPLKTKDRVKLFDTVSALRKLDYNLVFLNKKNSVEEPQKKQIDLWWNGNSRNLNFGLALLKYISTDQAWRTAKIRVMVINYNSARTDSIYALLNQMLNNSRLLGTVKVINNATERASEQDIIASESGKSSLTILESNLIQSKSEDEWFNYISWISEIKGTTLLIESGTGFEELNAHTIPYVSEINKEEPKELVSLGKEITPPSKEILADETHKIIVKLEEFHNNFVNNTVSSTENALISFSNDFHSLITKTLSGLEKCLKEKNSAERLWQYFKVVSDLSFQSKMLFIQFKEKTLTETYESISLAHSAYLNNSSDFIKSVPEKLIIKYSKPEFALKRRDLGKVKYFKLRNRFRGSLFGWPLNHKVELGDAAELFLISNRLVEVEDYYKAFGLNVFRFIGGLRRSIVDLSRTIDLLQANLNNTNEVIDAIENIKSQAIANFEENITEFASANRSCAKTLKTGLKDNLQRLCFVTDKPESSYLASSFKNHLKSRTPQSNSIDNLPDVWQHNLQLFINKIQLEFLTISLKHRLNIKLGKQLDDIQQKIESKFTHSIKSLKALTEEYKKGANVPDLSSIEKSFADLYNLNLTDSFESFSKDVGEIVKELPEQVKVNDLQFFVEIEKAQFPESDIRVIDYRKKAEFYIGSELISKAMDASEEISETLREASSRIRDRIKLASFSIENILNNDEITKDEQKLKIEEVLNVLLEELFADEKKASKAFEVFENNLEEYLKLSIEPIQSILFAHPDKTKTSKGKIIKILTPPRWSKRVFSSAKDFFNNQLVSLLYSQSEGIMIAKKITSFERDHKISNQATQELLQSLLPKPEVIKKLPFYYTSLFSGSTAINKDLWVGRGKELAEAESIANRFKAGYSGGLLITGNRNEGKTSFSKFIAQKYFTGYTVHSIRAPKGGSSSKADFEMALQKALNISSESTKFLDSSPGKRIIIISDIELWWDRHENGGGVITYIKKLIEDFGSEIFFMVNCGAIAYKLINRLYKLDSYFMGHIHCEPFDARELKEMIITRHRTGGLKLFYNGKYEDSLSEWSYARLFNKYFHLSRGNPGYASLLWLSNITKVAGKTIYIKSPSVPTLDHLKDISEDIWMIILQLALHRRTTIERLAKVLRVSEEDTMKLIVPLQRAGLVEERFPEVFAINAYLEPFLMEKLQEKGFI